VLSGTGVSGLYFDPAVAGVGTHVLTYSVSDENGCDSTITAIFKVILNEICINLKFSQGWNIFSVNSTIYPADIMDSFQALIDSNSLIKIQDELGNSLENWGILGGWQNNIGDILPTEGYKIKMNAGDSLVTCGMPVKYPFAIPLKPGWNIIGFPQQTGYNGMNVIQQLIDRGTLIKVQDERGYSIEDWGILGGWQNNIGNFIPGEGYKINVSADEELWIYENYPKTLTISQEVIATTHFRLAFIGNGVDHMNINLVDLPLNKLNVGDELAIFDGETCVGAVPVMPYHLHNRTISIAASASDYQGMPGFKEGNQITWKEWNSQNNNEFILEPEIVRGLSIFTKHETTVASLEKYTTTGFEKIPGTNIAEFTCYPNPFNEDITIEINLKTETKVQVEVLNELGQLINSVASKHLLSSGLHNFSWDGKNANYQAVSPGIYLLRIGIGDFIMFRKIVFAK